MKRRIHQPPPTTLSSRSSHGNGRETEREREGERERQRETERQRDRERQRESPREINQRKLVLKRSLLFWLWKNKPGGKCVCVCEREDKTYFVSYGRHHLYVSEGVCVCVITVDALLLLNLFVSRGGPFPPSEISPFLLLYSPPHLSLSP